MDIFSQMSHATRNPAEILCVKQMTVVTSQDMKLLLGSNRLNGLPDELREVAGLKDLDISGNSFTCLPSVVYLMEGLRKVDASNNNIYDIDIHKLKKIVSLTDINLEKNPLTEQLLAQLSEIDVFRVSTTSTEEQESSNPDKLEGVD